jgi:hypothetical protein
MDLNAARRYLTSDSDEIAELNANLNLVEGFIAIAREINALPDVKRRFYEESRSLFQITVVDRDIKSLESILSKFFGLPAKPAGKSMPRKLRKNSAVKYLGGLQQNQSLFLLSLKTGQFYGALWPWRRSESKIELHLGYCSDWMTDSDYQQLENLVKNEVSHDTFTQMGADIGGQIRGISLPSFLQMAEMEKASFSLRVSSHRKTGSLHISDGNLISADYGDLGGCDAAYEIISWEDTTIDIESLDTSKSDEIKQPLMQVLMESLKLKDETTSAPEKPPAPPIARTQASESATGFKRLVQLERTPKPRKPRKRVNWMTIAIAAVGATAIVAAIYAAAIHMFNSRVQKEDYELLVNQVDRVSDPKTKKSQLQAYLKNHPGSEYRKVILAKIEAAEKQIEEIDFEAVTLEVSALPVDDAYEKKAVKLYEQFLEKYPNSRMMPQINRAINEIKTLIDQYYYEELKYAARLNFNERVKIYRQYLTRFPKGQHRNDVDILIDEMGKKHLEYITSQESECEQNKRWDACIATYDRFSSLYQGHPLAETATAAKERLVAKRDYQQLQRATADAGNDYLKVLSLYRSYAATHPRNPYKDEIDNKYKALNEKIELQRKWIALRNDTMDPRKDLSERIRQVDQYLRVNRSSPYASEAESLKAALENEHRSTLLQNRQQAQKREQQAMARRKKEEAARRQARIKQLSTKLNMQLSSSPRYQPKEDGTVLDRKTGLIWTLLDSEQELGGCLTHEEARQYVANLKHGASNWRLPTANELASILKQPPYYPSSGARWYWTSEVYVKGFHSVADVVTAENESVFKREHRPQNECGAARAVRSP